MSIFANCGEYLPGQKPPDDVSVSSYRPNDIIVHWDDRRRKWDDIYRRWRDRIPPWEPPKWRCQFIAFQYCPPPFQNQVANEVNRCRICDGQFSPAYGNYNPLPGEFGCEFADQTECENNCSDFPSPCPDPGYECVEVERDCQEVRGPDWSGTLVIRSCQICDPNTNPNCTYPSESACLAGPGNGEFPCETDDGCRPIVQTGYKCVTETKNCAEWKGPDYYGEVDVKSCEACDPATDPECSYPTEAECLADDCITIDTCYPIEPPEPLFKCEQEDFSCEEKFGPANPGFVWEGAYFSKECVACAPGEADCFTEEECKLSGGIEAGNSGYECKTRDTCKQVEDTGGGGGDPTGVIITENSVRYKCSVEEILCTPPLVGVRRIVRNCVECYPTRTASGGWEFEDPTCSYETVNQCSEQCQSSDGACYGGNTNNVTYSVASFGYKCKSNSIPCSEYYNNNNVTGTVIRRECEPCMPGDDDCFPNQAQCNEAGCATTEDCVSVNQTSTGFGQVIFSEQPQTNSVSPFGFSEGLQSNITVPNPNVTIVPGFRNTDFAGFSKLRVGTSVTDKIVPKLKSKFDAYVKNLGSLAKTEILNINTQAYNLEKNNEVSVKSIVNGSDDLHPYYNFFSVSSTSDEITFVDNDLYRNIFADRVAKEVKFLLERNASSNLYWDERPLQLITNVKIGMSLNPILLRALNNLKYPSGERIPLDVMLDVVSNHLTTASLDSYNESYYIALADKQSETPFKSYIKSSDKNALASVVLNLVKQNEVTLSKNNKTGDDVRKLRRLKRLNVDVEAKTCVIKDDGTECHIDVENAGLLVGKIDVDGSSIVDASIANGPGDGYYLYLNVDGNCVSFNYDTKEEFSRFITQNTRFAALKLLDENPEIEIRSESTTSSHEFTSGALNIEYAPMFMKLNLDSVSTIPSKNFLVERVTGTFTRLVDQNLINEHTDTYGLATLSVHMDYRDPLFKYIYDTSTLTYSQNDITLYQLEAGINIGTEKSENTPLITRTIPFSLVVIPVRGTQFNPFNGLSEIVSFNNNTVIRSAKFIPNIDYVQSQESPHPLEEKFLYFENGSYKVGLKEPNDANAITYRFNASSDYLSNTYFDPTSKQYTGFPSSLSSIPLYGLSYMVNEVIDKIILNHSASSVAWYDVFRRMPMGKISEASYEFKGDMISKITSGIRDNFVLRDVYLKDQGIGQVTVNYGGSVLASTNDYGILDDDENVIITTEKRLSYLEGGST